MNPTERDFAQERRKKNTVLFLSVLVAFVAILLTIIFIVHSAPPAYAIHMPTFPKKVKYDDYTNQAKANAEATSIDEAFQDEVNQFSYTSTSHILGKASKDKNALYSPISLFMASAMLTELASNQTRQELLSALNMDNITQLQTQASKLYRSLYIDDGIAKLKLANSVWFDKNLNYNNATLKLLATEYYAYSFGVDFSKKSTATEISKWILENTGGKLGKDANDFATDPDQILALYNTIYFYDEWTDCFNEENTVQDSFHLADNQTVENDFMNSVQTAHQFTDGDGYLASSLYFKQSGKMMFILPDKGVSPYDILNDKTKLGEALNPSSQDNQKIGEVTFKIPKFDFSNKIELIEALKRMGITSAFDEKTADFSALSAQTKSYVSKITQSSTISINEKGAEAAAYTEIRMEATSMPLETTEKAEMILDRPFLFAIMSNHNTPLFIGIINNPTLQ